MTGFISGYNVHSDGVFDDTPWQTSELLLLKMKVFCEANPDTAFVRGVGGLISSLADGRLENASDLVSVRNQGRAVMLYRETLDVVREALEGAGYAITDADGTFGSTFAEALTNFQSARGLPETGLPDQVTLNRLLN